MSQTSEKIFEVHMHRNSATFIVKKEGSNIKVSKNGQFECELNQELALVKTGEDFQYFPQGTIEYSEWHSNAIIAVFVAAQNGLFTADELEALHQRAGVNAPLDTPAKQGAFANIVASFDASDYQDLNPTAQISCNELLAGVDPGLFS